MACWVCVDLTRQRLEIRNDAPSGSRDAPPPAADPDTLVHACAISSGLNGIGELDGSGCTPTGWQVVRAAIGKGNPLGAVYRGRRFTGEVFTPRLAAEHPERDWILTRILWLSGREPGINRGRNAADSASTACGATSTSMARRPASRWAPRPPMGAFVCAMRICCAFTRHAPAGNASAVARLTLRCLAAGARDCSKSVLSRLELRLSSRRPPVLRLVFQAAEPRNDMKPCRACHALQRMTRPAGHGQEGCHDTAIGLRNARRRGAYPHV